MIMPKHSEKLYGREKEIESLITIFNRICNGEGILLTLPGHSGIGKTSLVTELREPVQAGNGIFISGKFEQYQQNIPYFAIQQALKGLVKQIDESDSVSRKKLIDRAKAELGSQARVLNDFIPEFEKLFGKQPTLGDISPQEARHRFFSAMRKFFKAICLPEHPVVLFIDDWQWADLASLELLKNLGVGHDLRYLLLVASYRDNEVSKNSLLISTLEELKQKKYSLEEQKVGPISIKDVRTLIQDSFLPRITEKENLAKLIFETTGGNPFFIKSLFNYLVETGFISFSKNKNHWTWINRKDRRDKIPQEIVELFRKKLKSYDKEVQKIVALAACLGNSFHHANLRIIYNQAEGQLNRNLAILTKNDILVPLNGTSDMPDVETKSKRFIFRHDRLQQAAYSLINAEEMDALQLEIGRLLLKEMPEDEREVNIFELLNKLNAGYELMEDRQEIIELIKLNIKGAKKAFESTAYAAALQYFHAVGRIISCHSLDDFMWKENYATYFEYYIKRSESEFLGGQYALAENCLEVAIMHARTAIEKADAYNSLIVQFTLQARYEEAIKNGREALKLLGIHLPKGNFSYARDQEIAKVYSMLKDKKIDDLARLPAMEEPEILRATKILITMGPPCYRSHQRLWSVMVPIVVRLSLQYGNIPQAGYSHTAFGGLLIWVNRDYKTARQFSDLAIDLMEKKFRDPSYLSVFYLMIGSSNRHWFEHLSQASRDYKEAYEIGLRSGNLQYAAYAFGHNMYNQFFQGIDLTGLIEETKRSLGFGKTRHNQWAIDLFEGGLMILRSLAEEPDNQAKEIVDDQNYLEDLDNHHNIQVLCIYRILKVYSLLFHRRLEEGLKVSRRTDALLFTVGTQGLLPWPEHLFTRYLLLTGLYSTQEAKIQNEFLEESQQILKQLAEWAEVCPQNYQHKYLLARAEMARIRDEINAFDFYEKAIEEAKTQGFIQWEGMANELSAFYWKIMRNDSFAFNYWKNAYVCYQQWGARAKLSLMRQDYVSEMEEKILLSGFTGHSEDKIKELKKQMMGKQLHRLDLYARQLHQVKLNERVTSYADELASATKRLREEIKIRKGVETALRESEEMFHSLFSNMSEGVALHEFIRKKGEIIDYRIVNVNPSFLSILGLSRKEVIGKPASEIFGTPKAPYLEEYTNVYLTQEPYSFETYFKEKNNYFSISAVPWLSFGFATIFSDITLRTLNEQKIKNKNEELKKINFEKDKFLSIISHDLRSPLASIKNLIEIHLRKSSGQHVDFPGKHAQVIGDTVTQTLELLENLIEWSQTRSGRIKFQPEDIALRQCLDELSELFELSSQQKKLEILLRVDPSTRVYADRQMLNTILRNLLSNAVKYSNSGGKIEVASGKTSNGIEVSIKDQGIGIDKKDLEVLFHEGKKESKRGTQNERGSGLGLVLCKEFVERHGGKIHAESKKGMGSVFSFSLPETPEDS